MPRAAAGNYLGGALGVIGALPLIPLARGAAARLVPPARLPGAERLVHDLKAATWVEAAVIVFALPGAALLFGSALPRRLGVSARLSAAWPGAAFSAALPLCRGGVRASTALAIGLILSAAACVLQRRRAGAGPTRRARRLAAAAVFSALFAATAFAYFAPDGDVDLFEEGHLLGPAQVYRAGGRPFVDTYPIHGWGADGGVDGFVFARFSPDLRLFRARRAAATALELCALAALGLGLFGHAGWAAVAFVAALSISPFASERPGVAVAAMAAMALAARRRDVRLWVAAGALAAAALFFTLDFGVAALSGGLAAAALLGAVDERTDGPWRAAGAFAAGVGAGTLPFALLLLRDGALTAFCRVSFVDLPRDIGDIWGLPAGTSAAAIVDGGGAEALALVRGETMPALFLLGLLATAVGVWAARALDRVVDETDRAVAPVTLVGLAALRGALGRADGGHLAFYGVLAGFPAAWLLFRAAHARRFATATTVLTATVLAVALRPDRAIRTQARLLAWAASRHAATLQALAQPGPDRRAPASRGQAAEIRALRAFMDARLRPGETFFDYTSEPALYFLLDRLPPVRYGIVPFYEPEAKQREVIAALERVRPPLAIVSAGPRYDAPDSISHRERTPLVAAYLDAAYEPLAEVAGRTIAQRRRPAASAPAPP